jgi:hypothetical protein
LVIPPTLAPTHSLLADAAPGHNYASTLRIRRHTFVFVSQRGMPRTTAGFARMIERAAVGAGLDRQGGKH